MKTSSKNLLIILAVLIVVLVAANYFFYHVIRSTGTEISNKQQEISSLQNQVQEFSKYRPEDLKQLAESVMAKIIPHGDFVDFIENIETKARSQGLEIKVSSVNVVPRNEDDPNDDKQIMNLKLETTGSWTSTMYFLNYLEHLPYKISVKNLSFTKIESADPDVKNSNWQASFELTALKFK